MKNSFSIIIPAYKEEDFIEGTLRGILDAFKSKNLEFELIVVIDTVPDDKTLDIVENLSHKFKEILIIKREGKIGIASAIRDGIQKTSKSITMIVMADKSEDAYQLTNMAFKTNDGYDMVFGSRFLKGVVFAGYPIRKFVANRLCNYAIRILFGIKSDDTTNAVKAYKSEILKQMKITSSGFEVFAELPIKAYLKGYRNIAEIPLSHVARDATLSKLNLNREGPRYFKLIIKCFLKKLTRNKDGL